ncbi:IS66 family transposase [Methylobacterium sp.]|uniref:IS66 family transposase n=1 Tax=Methylobacterium sp. TaxID=409 RepID=UPI003B5CD461
MEPSPGTVDLASLAPPLQALVEGQQATVETLRAEVASLTERNRRLEQREPDAVVKGLRSRVASLTEQNRRLEHLLNELRRAMFAKKSEKLHPDQLLLAFEELEGALAEAEADAPANTTPTPRAKRPAAERNLGHLPAHLPRSYELVEPQSTQCPCGCGEMVKIGEDRTERLDVVPAQLRVIVTIRPKYACRECEEGVTQAPAPAHLIEGGLPTEGMLAHVLVSKFADHLPLYRQAQIYARSGIDLHRSTLALWVGKASFELRPVYDCLGVELKKSNNLGLDETTVRVLDPGRGKTKTGYMWTMARDQRGWSGPDPPGVIYDYAPSRSGKHGEKLLEGFKGTVQVDGYSGHNRLARADRPGGALTLAACWIHARRGLKEVFDSNGSPIAKAGLKRIAELYKIEDKIRGESPATRQFVRWTESAPLVNAFGVWLDEQRSRVSPRSRLGEKLTYIANQWEGLLVFLYDGRVEMDSNFVENRIRPIKLTAKNALFAGHDEGATHWGRIGSLIETCKMNGVEPYAWLKSTLEKIAAGHPQSRIHELLPWNFDPAST